MEARGPVFGMQCERLAERACQRGREVGTEGRLTMTTHKPTYSSWASMIQRCTNPNAGGYHRYGGRGIRVCERWRDSYAAFLADVGPRPPGRTLDRINNDGNYEPGNCRWATKSEQRINSTSGRKPRAGADTHTVCVRATDSERARWERGAMLAGATLSTWIRCAIERQCESIEREHTPADLETDGKQPPPAAAILVEPDPSA